MKILLVAATLAEIEPTMEQLPLKIGINDFRKHQVFVLITGVGMVATAYALGKTFGAEQFDLAINAGIAGSFIKRISLGEVVRVSEDCFPELGAEDGEDFVSIDQLGFGKSGVVPPEYNHGLGDFRQVRGITVNKVHGNEFSIEKTLKRLSPDVESMEGAAFFYACNDVNLPGIQLRAISNYIEKRNRANWNISLAVKNLNDALINIFSELT